MEVDDLHIIGIIKHKGVVNVQELCRIINGRDFKWCHTKQPRGTEYDNRYDAQFVKQCNDCQIHYRDLHEQVMRLIKEKKIETDKRVFYDRINDKGDKRHKGKKRELYRFLFVDHDVFKKKILIETLEYY